MADTSNPQETASKTAEPNAEQAGTAAALQNQSRMCCAVGDLSCVVPVVTVTTPQALTGQRAEGNAPKAPEAAGPSATRP